MLFFTKQVVVYLIKILKSKSFSCECLNFCWSDRVPHDRLQVEGICLCTALSTASCSEHCIPHCMLLKSKQKEHCCIWRCQTSRSTCRECIKQELQKEYSRTLIEIRREKAVAKQSFLIQENLSSNPSNRCSTFFATKIAWKRWE